MGVKKIDFTLNPTFDFQHSHWDHTTHFDFVEYFGKVHFFNEKEAKLSLSLKHVRSCSLQGLHRFFQAFSKLIESHQVNTNELQVIPIKYYLSELAPAFVIALNQSNCQLPEQVVIESFYVPTFEMEDNKFSHQLMSEGEHYFYEKNDFDLDFFLDLKKKSRVHLENYVSFLSCFDRLQFQNFEHMLDSAFVINEKGNIVYANQTAIQLSGVSSKRLMTKKKTFKDFLEFKNLDLFIMGGEIGRNDFSQLHEESYQVKNSEKIEEKHAQVFINPIHHLPFSRKYWLVYLHDVSLERQLDNKYKSSSELALTDDMTGLKNFRGLQALLDQELHRSKRYAFDVGIVMIDVDHFKKFNDTYGHLQGDAVLKVVAEKLQECCRKSDIAARYGGEEFMLILPQTDAEGVYKVAERCRQLIEETAVPHLQDPAQLLKVTASFGVLSLSGEYLKSVAEINSQTFIKECDELLYQSKSDGRNRVSFKKKEV